MKEVPVLIVGGGAAGTMLTLELARRGVKALTVDRLPKASETSNAITVHARSLEIFERIDKRLAERFLERGIHNVGYVLHFVDGAGKRSEVRPGIDFRGLDSRYKFILVNRQSETEQYLREYASAHYGASIEWGTQCVGVEPDADGVTATLETDGKRRDVRCRYLVALRRHQFLACAGRSTSSRSRASTRAPCSRTWTRSWKASPTRTTGFTTAPAPITSS